MPEKRQLAAIMFTDIVGYSALMGKHVQQAQLKIKHSEEVKNSFGRIYWIITKVLGDGCLMSFSVVLMQYIHRKER